MGFSDPVDLPEHGESGLVFVLIFEDLRYYCRVHSELLWILFIGQQEVRA